MAVSPLIQTISSPLTGTTHSAVMLCWKIELNLEPTLVIGSGCQECCTEKNSDK